MRELDSFKVKELNLNSVSSIDLYQDESLFYEEWTEYI
jgi:hypothetical protein